MRKQNAEFLTAFTSEANKDLKNTDSFGFVELDQFACYVVADGIDDKIDAIAAKLAVDTVISTFTEAPSMSKRRLSACLKSANNALLHAKSKMKLKVSITVIVTDYIKLRYGQAGNTRLRLYRSGFLKEQSKDTSLSADMVQTHKIEADKLEQHEERNNLYCYLGQKEGFYPFISKKIKLSNSDVIALYTRGIWEYVDEGELKDAFADATTEPQETVDAIEDLLLSKQPKNLEKYTFVTIFVNKVYIDPNKKRKIKKIIMALIPILTVVITLSIILYVRYDKKRKNIEEMNEKYLSTIEYIQSDNYVRASEEVDKAIELAEKVKDKKMKKELENYKKLIESVIAADEKLDEKKYDQAQQAYQKASNRSRYADNLGKEYIEEGLEVTADYLSVYDLISLGDTLALNLQYEKAEEKYLEAKALAGKIYFDEGRNSAIAALERLYEDQKKDIEEKDKKVQEEAAEQTAGASIVAQGDSAFAAQDYDSAKVYYTTALKKYIELGDEIQKEAVNTKLQAANKKIEEQKEKEKEAQEYLLEAQECIEQKDFLMAKKYYLFAKDIYASLKNDDKVDEIGRKMELLDLEKEREEFLEESSKNMETSTEEETTTEEEKEETESSIEESTSENLPEMGEGEEESGVLSQPIEKETKGMEGIELGEVS